MTDSTAILGAKRAATHHWFSPAPTTWTSPESCPWGQQHLPAPATPHCETKLFSCHSSRETSHIQLESRDNI